MKKFFLLPEESAVVPAHPEQSIGIDLAQFRHCGGYILQEVAVMAYDHAGKCGLFQQSFEPFDTGEI